MKFNWTYLISVPHQTTAYSTCFNGNLDIINYSNEYNWDYVSKTLKDAKEFLNHDFNSSHWFSSTQGAIYCFAKNYNHHQLPTVRFLIMNILQDELNLEIEADLKAYKYSSRLDLEFHLIVDGLRGEKILNKSKNFEYIVKKAKEAEKKLWEDKDFESLYNSVKILIKEK